MLKFPISCFNDKFWEFVRMAVTWPLQPPAALCGALARSVTVPRVNCEKPPGNQQH